MYLTKAEEYGICGAIYLAQKPPKEVTPLSEISRNQQVPEKFLAKIFQQMARARILVSHRGVKGGYSLARPAAEIRLSEVIGLFHHDAVGTEQNSSGGGCMARTNLHEVVREAKQLSESVYGKYSLSDLMPSEAITAGSLTR